MLLEAPPSRYRVVERDGRLTVIDTQEQGAPRSAREIIAGDRAGLSMPPYTPPRRRPGSSIEPFAIGPRPAPGRRATGPTDAYVSPTARSDDPLPFLRRIAASMTGDVRDGSGRLMLSTASWLDAKDPRDIALSAAGEQAFGAVVLAVTAALLLLLVVLIAFTDLMLPVTMLGLVALSRSKPLITRAIDTFARL